MEQECRPPPGPPARVHTYAHKNAGNQKAQISIPCNGTAAMKLRPGRPYNIGICVRQGTGQPAAGVLRLRLEDGSDTSLNATAPCQQLVTCSTLTDTYTWYTAIIWTPYLIPDDAAIVIDTSTALGDGENIYIGAVAIAEAHQLAAPGTSGVQNPILSVISGSTPWVKGDTITVTITNDNSANTFIMEMDRLFDLHGMTDAVGEPLLLPTATTPAETIADSLIA